MESVLKEILNIYQKVQKNIVHILVISIPKEQWSKKHLMYQLYTYMDTYIFYTSTSKFSFIYVNELFNIWDILMKLPNPPTIKYRTLGFLKFSMLILGI